MSSAVFEAALGRPCPNGKPAVLGIIAPLFSSRKTGLDFSKAQSDKELGKVHVLRTHHLPGVVLLLLSPESNPLALAPRHTSVQAGQKVLCPEIPENYRLRTPLVVKRDSD